MMPSKSSRLHPPTFPVRFTFLVGVLMAYGWGYRGIVGHEGGAMIPGAMLGMAVCLASGRLDWQRRAAVAGLFGAVGWAWGGSLSYMEQTMYTVSDSFIDVYYGYAVLFLMGGLWAGIGGAILGLAFTLPRSQLHRFTGPFVAMSAAFLATYLILLFNPTLRDNFERFTAEQMHDGDWFSATTTLVVCGIYALVRPKARAEAGLFAACAIAWWIGYAGFTKLGGLSLGPPYRSESWGGLVGVLAVLIAYLIHTRNFASLMLCLYGAVGGGIAFALAVFIRHPVRVSWGPFAEWGGMMQWKIAEESFGFFMGIAIALGVLRLARGRLAPAEEDAPRTPLDVFAVFVLLIALLWMNLRRAPMAWLYRYEFVSTEPVAGLSPGIWYLLGGIFLTALALYALRLYARDDLAIAPATPFGKGALVLLLLVWITVVAAFVQQFPAAQSETHPLVDASFILLAGIATAMLLAAGTVSPLDPEFDTPPSDPRWRTGWKHALVWAAVPVILVLISGLSMAMQDGPTPGMRKRFGPEAYWREASQVVGQWELFGTARDLGGETTPATAPDFTHIEFKKNRAAVLTRAGGTKDSESHRWHHADSRIHLDWFGREDNHPEARTLAIGLHEGRLYIPWPPHTADGYYVFERVTTE